eukprot:jgi/Hompol1/1052/HPOL_001162-RA
MAYETNILASSEASAGSASFMTITIITLLFMSIYLLDAVVRIFSDYTFFNNAYNILDLVVLAIYFSFWISSLAIPTYAMSTGLRILRALRILRIFRIIPSIRSLQVVVDALLGTLATNVVDLLILLTLFVFVSGVIGHFLFGMNKAAASTYANWGTLPQSLNTLWVYVCADGWTTYQDDLERDGYYGSQAFTIVFICIGNFIIANLFIGVICQNIDEASKMERQRQLQQRRDAKVAKRELFLRRQRRDMLRLVAQVIAEIKKGL